MNLLAAALGSAVTWTRTTAFVIMGAGLADIWHFHSMGTNVDLVLIVGAASALGVHLAMQASAAAAAAKNPPAA